MSAEEEIHAVECDVEAGECEEETYYEEEEEDTTIKNSDVVVRYKKAAQWANETLEFIIGLCVPGAKVYDVCLQGDAKLTEKMATMFRGTVKSIAFPTTISVNACVCHWAPVPGESSGVDLQLAEGDVARIDLGLQIDGYPVMVAHTVQVTAAGAGLGATPEAAVIAAANATLEAAVRQLRPEEANTSDVTAVIEKCAAHFGLTPVEGALSHSMRRYVPDSIKAIGAASTPEHILHEYPIEAATVWCLDIVLSTGKGALKERDAKTGIYKPSIDSKHSLRLASARELQKEISTRFSTFPFAVRSLKTKNARLGLSEMLKYDVVTPYPVLFERSGVTVAQFKATVLVTAKRIERITGLPPQKGCPKPPPYTDEALLAKTKLPLTFKKKNKKVDSDTAEAKEV